MISEFWGNIFGGFTGNTGAIDLAVNVGNPTGLIPNIWQFLGFVSSAGGDTIPVGDYFTALFTFLTVLALIALAVYIPYRIFKIVISMFGGR